MRAIDREGTWFFLSSMCTSFTKSSSRVVYNNSRVRDLQVFTCRTLALEKVASFPLIGAQSVTHAQTQGNLRNFNGLSSNPLLCGIDCPRELSGYLFRLYILPHRNRRIVIVHACVLRRRPTPAKYCARQPVSIKTNMGPGRPGLQTVQIRANPTSPSPVADP